MTGGLAKGICSSLVQGGLRKGCGGLGVISLSGGGGGTALLASPFNGGSVFLYRNNVRFFWSRWNRFSDKLKPTISFWSINRHSHSGQEPSPQETQLNKRLPPLTQFPSIIWPKFTNTLRNWFFTYFVIKPYFDRDFAIQDFMEGAHEAVSLISNKLSAGEYDDLEGLVEPTLLSELKQKLSTFSVSQQDLLRVAKEDIFFSFPYQIGIIIPDSPDPDPGKFLAAGQKPPPQTRHVEITVVLHVLRGMAEMQRTNKDASFSIVDFTKEEENKYRVMVCNYRFFRDFTEGCKDPSWIINMVNHFLPAEIPR